ncbi:MAG: rhodanese-like domain-containing protein [Magnetococcus sp. DMHC-1]
MVRAMRAKRVSAKKFLEMVRDGVALRIIDFRGDYSLAIPGSIPTWFDPKIFYADEGMVQDMLGVAFRERQSLLLVCEHGHLSVEAARYFVEKNPGSATEIWVLKGGWQAYRDEITRLTRRFRNGSRFQAELTSLETAVERWRYVVREILARRSIWQRLF